MVVKCLSSMHHFVPTQPLPAPLLLPSPFPQLISCRTISNMAPFRLPLARPLPGAPTGRSRAQVQYPTSGQHTEAVHNNTYTKGRRPLQTPNRLIAEFNMGCYGYADSASQRVLIGAHVVKFSDYAIRRVQVDGRL